MNWTNDDIKIVEKFINIKNRGLYADGKQVTDVYNRVLDKTLPSTNCGSCIRHRITELETALNRFKRMNENKPFESVSEAKVEDSPQEENKALAEAEKMKERMAKVRAARGKKKDAK